MWPHRYRNLFIFIKIELSFPLINQWNRISQGMKSRTLAHSKEQRLKAIRRRNNTFCMIFEKKTQPKLCDRRSFSVTSTWFLWGECEHITRHYLPVGSLLLAHKRESSAQVTDTGSYVISVGFLTSTPTTTRWANEWKKTQPAIKSCCWSVFSSPLSSCALLSHWISNNCYYMASSFQAQLFHQRFSAGRTLFTCAAEWEKNHWMDKCKVAPIHYMVMRWFSGLARHKQQCRKQKWRFHECLVLCHHLRRMS